MLDIPTLLDGDRMRLCLHPRVVPHPSPALAPRIVKATLPVVMDTPKRPLKLVRCLECGLVLEPAK